MIVGRTKEIQQILVELHKPVNPADKTEDIKRIIAINGLFGVGKSTLLRNIVAQVETLNCADALLTSNEDAHVKYLPEFVYQLMNSFKACKPGTPRFRSDETDARWMRFSEIAGELKSRDEKTWQRIEERASLRSGAEMMEYEPQLTGDNNFDSTIRSQFKSSDDQRLTLDTGNVISEALIVDLMNTFFPLIGGVQSLEDYLVHTEPVKIVILIDTYEKISATLNQWLLENFLPYCYSKRFGDFRSYNSPYLTPDLFVSQFFDFRFIIAGREPLSFTDSERRWDRWRTTMLELHLDEFTDEEIKTFLKKEGIQDSVNIKEIREVTTGLPYLVTLWADVFKARRAGADSSYLAALAQERIFWYKTDQQKEWIRVAAFCDWFDGDTLRCFEASNTTHREAYNYLRHSAELTRPSEKKQGKISLHPIIAKSIKEATEQESRDVARQYSTVATTFYTANDLLGKYNAPIREALRNLAYFNNFDVDFALPRFLPDDTSLIKNIVLETDDLIVKNKHTFKLDDKYKTVLADYNKLVDSTSYEDKYIQVREIWNNRKRTLEADKQKTEQEVEQLKQQMFEYEGELDLKKKLADDAQTRAIEAENELVLLRRRGPYRLASKDIAASRLAFFTGLILGVLGYVSPELIKLIGNVPPDTGDSVQRALYTFAVVFGMLFLFFMSRAFYINSQRKEQERQRATIEQAEQKSISERELFQRYVKERETILKNIEQLQSRTQELTNNIKIHQEKLNESYI